MLRGERLVEGRWDGGRGREGEEGKRKRGEEQVSGQERYKVLLTNILPESVGKIVLRQGTEGWRSKNKSTVLCEKKILLAAASLFHPAS